MRFRLPRFRPTALGRFAAALAFVVAVPASALAQYGAPGSYDRPTGENYHVELSFALWNPKLFGRISSSQFDIIGSTIDFVDDLSFTNSQFKDVRLVLRPATKHRFRFQYTPLQYSSDTVLNRPLVFNGITFPAGTFPIRADFGWRVLRGGYEYDFVYTNHGFVGILLEARYTDFSAELRSVLSDEFTRLKAPLPSIGIVTRIYIVSGVALNIEVSGMNIPIKDYQARYKDIDVYGTVNITDHLGLNVGWRYMTTFLGIKKDIADLQFKGLWFGGALRF